MKTLTELMEDVKKLCSQYNDPDAFFIEIVQLGIESYLKIERKDSWESFKLDRCRFDDKSKITLMALFSTYKEYCEIRNLRVNFKNHIDLCNFLIEQGAKVVKDHSKSNILKGMTIR